MYGFGISDEEKDSSNNNNNNNVSKLYSNLLDFPHCDASRIDLRTLEAGDGKTFANPFASVDLQYTGYIVDSKNARDKSKWRRFIDESTSKTIFETKLGSNENIIGLEQAVLSMSLGETAIVWVPSRLGYGTHGAPRLIPPNSDIVFELTLVSIQNDNELLSNEDEDMEAEDDGLNGMGMNEMDENELEDAMFDEEINNDMNENGVNNMNPMDDDRDVLFD